VENLSFPILTALAYTTGRLGLPLGLTDSGV